jgi:ABC-type transport system involved in multi-copper enzyme maturation permease subunit
MLFYKAWVESRWRFICGAVAVTALSILFVRLHPILIPQWRLGLALQDPHAIKPRWLPLGVSDYRFYIWHFLFDFRLQNLWVLLAIVLSFGGLLREHANGTVAFSLSLPVTRNRWLISRVLIAFLETTVLAWIPAVVVPIASVSVGQSYPIGQGFAHGLLMAGVGSVFVGLAAFLSLILRGEYTPLAVTLAMLAVPYLVLQEWARRVSWARKIDIAHVMAGAWLLTWRDVPWLAIAMVCLLTALFLGLAARQGRRLEF